MKYELMRTKNSGSKFKVKINLKVFLECKIIL